jgi:hypothetical protein
MVPPCRVNQCGPRHSSDQERRGRSKLSPSYVLRCWRYLKSTGELGCDRHREGSCQGSEFEVRRAKCGGSAPGSNRTCDPRLDKGKFATLKLTAVKRLRALPCPGTIPMSIVSRPRQCAGSPTSILGAICDGRPGVCQLRGVDLEAVSAATTSRRIERVCSHQ